MAAADPQAKFRDVAKRESDCTSAHREGELGPFAKGKMQVCHPALDPARGQLVRLKLVIWLHFVFRENQFCFACQKFTVTDAPLCSQRLRQL